MNLVELPDDAVSGTWAPEIAAIAGGRIAARNEQRLLTNTLAHQWWGGAVSPATMNDAWITNGMSRYAELMYLEDSAGKICLPDRHHRHLRRCARLRHRAPDHHRPPRPLLTAVPVHDPRKGSDGLPHAPLGDGRRRLHQVPPRPLTQYTDKSDPHLQRRDPRRSAIRPELASLLRAVARWHRSAGLRQQILRLPPRRQQGLPNHRRHRSGPRPLPYADRTAHRDRWQN